MARRRVCMVLVGLTVLLVMGGLGVAAERWWQLNCSVDRPWLLVVNDPAGGSRYACVVTFRVTNACDQPVFYFPQFTLTTETGKLYRNVVDFAAERVAKARLHRPLATAVELMGELKPGETKEGLAVFPQPDPAADHFELYVGGLTNEYKVVERDGQSAVLRKVLVVEFYRPGDAYDVYLDKTYTVESRWVWR
jgi:hypothetical protein